MRRASAIGVVAASLLLACGQDAPSGIQPLPSLPSGARQAPIAAAPSPAVVSPHLRRAPSADRPETADRRPAGGGGGGVGPGSVWDVRPVREPRRGEITAFQTQLQRQMADSSETDDPCERAIDMFRAGAEALDPSAELPRDRELQRPCDALPESFQSCMSAEYFKAHGEECDAVLARMQAQGRDILERAERARDAREDAER